MAELTRSCVSCGADLTGRSSRTRACNKICDQRARRAAEKAAAPPRPGRPCEQCGKLFVPARGGQRMTSYCRRSCKDRARYAELHPPVPRAPRVQPLRALRQCEECGALVVGRRSQARFCGDPCGRAAYLRKRVEERAARSASRPPARGRAGRQEWYQRTAEQRRAYSREWAKANPDRVALNNHARRARRKAAGVFVVTERDWRRLVERYRGCCAYCGKPPADGVLHREHVVPLIRGGRHSIGNLVPACLACNYSKNRWLLTEWRHREGVLARAC